MSAIFDIVLDANTMGMKVKGKKMGKEELIMSLLVNDMIVNIEDPKESTGLLVERIREFHKVIGHKINIENQLYFGKQATNY